MDVLWPMGKCIDYTWMGGGDRAVSVEAGVLMRRTPSATAAEGGDPDVEDADGRGGGRGPRRGGHQEPQHRVEVHGAADVGSHDGV